MSVTKLPSRFPELSAREEAFACEWVASGGSMAAAYRKAYSSTARPSSVYVESHRVATRPHVAARIRALRDAAAASSIVRAADILDDWVAQARADPRELSLLQRVNCRHCHGLAGGYQWRDEDEWALAAAEAFDASKPPPDAAGGFGFRRTGDINPDCPRCEGEGVARVFLPDQRELSPDAVKLLAGVREKADGTVELQLHDPNKARENIARMMGYFKDGVAHTPTPIPANPIPETVTGEEAVKAYQRLLRA